MWTISGKISQKFETVYSEISYFRITCNASFKYGSENNINFSRTDKVKLKIFRFLVMNFEAEFKCALSSDI